MKIAVAGTGYVGLSIATLLAQHNTVTAVDIVPEKVSMINSRKSPIQDEYIEKYFAEKQLDLTATLDGAQAYKEAEFVIIADASLRHDIDDKEKFEKLLESENVEEVPAGNDADHFILDIATSLLFVTSPSVCISTS